MAGDACESKLDDLPGTPFFEDVSLLLATNPSQLNYGVAVTDTNADGVFEFVVAGFGTNNQIFQWDAGEAQYLEIKASIYGNARKASISKSGPMPTDHTPAPASRAVLS